MKKSIVTIVLGIAILTQAVAQTAETSWWQRWTSADKWEEVFEPAFSKWNVGVNIGTTGVGIDVATLLTEHVRARAGFSFMPKFDYNMHFGVEVRNKDGEVLEPTRFQRMAELLEQLTGKRPLQVLDPVFLLGAEEWRKIERQPTWFDAKDFERGYLLTYWLNGKPPKEIQSLAKELGLPVINMLDINNFNHYATGIEEFLYLLDHATFLCLQSFHGTAFATIFKKPFMIYKTGKLRTTRFSRIGSLLDLFGLSDRVAEEDFKIKLEDPLKIDFTRCEEVLPLERKKAFKFLSDALWR